MKLFIHAFKNSFGLRNSVGKLDFNTRTDFNLKLKSLYTKYRIREWNKWIIYFWKKELKLLWISYKIYNWYPLVTAVTIKNYIQALFSFDLTL